MDKGRAWRALKDTQESIPCFEALAPDLLPTSPAFFMQTGRRSLRASTPKDQIRAGIGVWPSGNGGQAEYLAYPAFPAFRLFGHSLSPKASLYSAET